MFIHLSLVFSSKRFIAENISLSITSLAEMKSSVFAWDFSNKLQINPHVTCLLFISPFSHVFWDVIEYIKT